MCVCQGDSSYAGQVLEGAQALAQSPEEAAQLDPLMQRLHTMLLEEVPAEEQAAATDGAEEEQ